MFDRHVRVQAQNRPQAPAILMPTRTISFSEFDADIDRVTSTCAPLEAAVDEAVAVAVADPYMHCLALLALARLGIASAPGDDAACRLRIGDGPAGGRPMLRLHPSDLAAAPPNEPSRSVVPPNPDALGRIVTSSGTTGERKRIGLSWRVIGARIDNAIQNYAVPEGPWIAATGAGTTFGFNIMLAAWAGGRAVVLGLPGAVDGATLARFRPRLVALIPAQLRHLLDSLGPAHPRMPLRVVAAAGAVPPPLARRTRALLTDDLQAHYGTTETGAVALASLRDIEASPAIAGRLLPSAEVEIVDEDGHLLAPGTLGHVRLRSDRSTNGYLDDPDRTERAFRNGWFHPGDMGRMSGDGVLFIEGRSDDLMNIAGHKILPLWIEQPALAVAGVRDAGACSLIDADGLERCWLALVGDRALDGTLLRNALARQLHFVVKIQVTFVPEIPRGALGKIDRIKLREVVRLAAKDPSSIGP